MSLDQSCAGFLRPLRRGPQGQVCGCHWFISAEITHAVSPYPTAPTHPFTLVSGLSPEAMRQERRWLEERE